MERKSLMIMVLLAFFSGSALLADSARYVPQTGHFESVTEIAVTENGNRMVSVGNDGTLRVWEPSSRDLVHKVQIGPLPIESVLLHPELTRAAVLESDGIAIHRLSIWDWSTGRKIFSRDLRDLPLYVSFSPAGSYVLYSNADWQSLTVLDADTGNRLPFLRNGFGIVSRFRVSTSEERVVCYLPSGSIQYRNIKSGTLVQDFPTVAGIEQGKFVLRNRYMIGIWEGSLIAIDLLSGEDVGSVRLDNILQFHANEENGDILCLIGPESPDETARFVSYSFNGRGFRSRFSRATPVDDLSSSFLVHRNTVYSGSKDGTLYYQTSFSSQPRVFSSNRLAHISDFDSTSSVLLATADDIVTIYADYLYQKNSRGSEQVLTHTQFNPLHVATAVEALGNGTYVLQDNGGSLGRYWLFSPVEGAIGLPNDLYAAPILSTDTKNQRILTVDADGRIQVFNLFASTFDFDMSVFGLQTAIFVHGDNVVASGRRSQALRTSKLLIDTSTGETVPFDDDSLETFQLAYEPMSHTLYTLSIEGTGTDPKTVLTQHTGKTFENSRVLFTMDGAHKDSTMSVSRGTLFFSTGGVNRALYAGSSRFITVDNNGNIPVKVEVMDDWLIGLNRDSSVSVWDRATGDHTLDFFLFNDLQWVAVTKAGGVVSSTQRIASYVREYK